MLLLKEKQIVKKNTNLIPNKLDILITHEPLYGILDKPLKGNHEGCKNLLEIVKEKKPKYHLFGHVHEGYGKMFDLIDEKNNLILMKLMN